MPPPAAVAVAVTGGTENHHQPPNSLSSMILKKQKTVCVMDASGLLGFELVKTLLQRGYFVHASLQSDSRFQGQFVSSPVASIISTLRANSITELANKVRQLV